MKVVNNHLAALLSVIPLVAMGQASSPAQPPGAAPTAKLSASTVAFGNVIYGGQPASQRIVLSNTGTAPLVISRIGMSGNSDFTQVNDCGSALQPSAKCTLSLL